MERRYRGVTLPEMVVVIAFIAIVSITIVSLFMQSARVYARTSSRVEPQASLMLAMHRMEKQIREAMFIRVGSSSTSVEIALPQKDTSGFIRLKSIEIDTTLHKRALVRIEGKHLCFFLGRRDPTNPGGAIPDAVNGNTIFLVTTGSDTAAGTDIIDSLGALAPSYSKAETIISGVLSIPTIVDPAYPGQQKPTTIFSYATNGMASSAFQDGLNAQIVRITLTVPIQQTGVIGTQNHTLSTQFCLRNFESLN
jgi:Tfp pilus assembly protein PilE